jgi:hypothetical protein
MEGVAVRTPWPGLFALWIAMLTPRPGLAQEQAALWATWDLPAAVTALPDSIAVSVPDSVRVRRGYQHGRKAALGGAIGGALGALTGALGAGVSSCDDCRRQPSAGGGALYGGLIGAGAGGVIGFLMGLSSPTYTWVPSADAPPGAGPTR